MLRPTGFSLLALAISMGPSATQAQVGTTTRVSVDSVGAEGNGASGDLVGNHYSSMSADGRFVAFQSTASTLVAGDTNAVGDVIVHDRATGATTRVSVNSGGLEGNALTVDPSITSDGRFVAFSSYSTNLVSGDTNGWWDVFVHDRQTGNTTRVSVSSAGAEGNEDSLYAVISADGRFVAFQSGANLVPGDTGPPSDVFVHDRATGTTTRVSVSSAGGQGNEHSATPSISADGRFVAFWSRATNLVAGDLNNSDDVFVHDRLTDVTTRVSVDSAGAEGNGHSATPSISADGSFVAFESTASNLVSGDTNAVSDVFVHDRLAGVTTRVSVDSASAQQGAGHSVSPSISANGRFVAFRSDSWNLTVGDTNGYQDVFVHDQVTGTTTRVSISSAGVEGNGNSATPSISEDGRFIAFTGAASNLVLNDTNGVQDVFIHELPLEPACRSGNVNSACGPVTPVLFLNGSAGNDQGVVTVPPRSPISLRLDPAPGGPSPASWMLWIWAALPQNPTVLHVGTSQLGCTVNPTPFAPFAGPPRPVKCLRDGLPAVFCAEGRELRSPGRVPWPAPITRAQGIRGAITLTLQGVIEDRCAQSPDGYSVTNAVVLVVQ